MAISDPWKRYLEAGMELTEVPRARAEKLVRDLVRAGEIQRQEAQHRVEELLDRSRKTTEAVAETVRVEVMRQLQNLGLVEPAKKPAAAKKATKTAAKTTGAAKKASAKTSATAKDDAGRS